MYMERRTLEENRENKRDYAVLVGLRSPVLREDIFKIQLSY